MPCCSCTATPVYSLWTKMVEGEKNWSNDMQRLGKTERPEVALRTGLHLFWHEFSKFHCVSQEFNSAPNNVAGTQIKGSYDTFFYYFLLGGWNTVVPCPISWGWFYFSNHTALAAITQSQLFGPDFWNIWKTWNVHSTMLSRTNANEIYFLQKIVRPDNPTC